MKHKLLFLALISTIVLKANAQYIEYKPNPRVVLPDMPPPQMYVPPLQHSVPLNYNVKPSINIISEYLITSAKVNGQDYSQHYINGKAAVVVFHLGNDSSPYFAVIIPGDNSNSSGKMSSVTSQELPQTTTSYGKTTLVFSWDFQNTADGKTGTATVDLIKEYRPNGTMFQCHIQGNNGISCDFQGMVSNLCIRNISIYFHIESLPFW